MADAKAPLFTRAETEAFAATIADRAVVAKAVTDEHGPPLGDALRALSKPLFSSDGGLTFRAYKLCAGCKHDVHDGYGKCTGLTARPEVTHAIGSVCLCESTP
jgi:hypothetical protein